MPQSAPAVVVAVSEEVPPRRTDFVWLATLTPRAFGSTLGLGLAARPGVADAPIRALADGPAAPRALDAVPALPPQAATTRMTAAIRPPNAAAGRAPRSCTLGGQRLGDRVEESRRRVGRGPDRTRSVIGHRWIVVRRP